MSRATLQRAIGPALALWATGAASQANPPPLIESPHSTVGYDSVSDALEALRAKPGVVLSTENGWLIATDEASLAVWSFAPEGYPAYPAVVKRQAVPQGTGSILKMSVLCEASKEACDDLVRTFARMNGIPLDR